MVLISFAKPLLMDCAVSIEAGADDDNTMEVSPTALSLALIDLPRYSAWSFAFLLSIPDQSDQADLIE